MMVGRTWKAKMAPELGEMTRPKAPELGRPSSPKRTWVPAKVAESIWVTASPAQAHGELAEAEAQHQEGEAELQAEAPGDGAPADAAAVGGEQPGGSENGENAQDSGEAIQSASQKRSVLSDQWIE